jgi:HK97 gp10 family phage protein
VINFIWRGDEVKRRMKEAGKGIMKQAAAYMCERAKMLAPVDTGALLNSIEMTSSMGGTKFTVVCKAPYAVYVEFGHMAGSERWVAPNPFMRTAMADTVAAFPQFGKDFKLGRPTDENDLEHLGVSIQKGQ